MAVMIPAEIAPTIKSKAEKHVFNWFKNAPGTDDWIVMHSLGISAHVRLIHGEIDFLVLAPGLGMFALEVKGGRVRRTLGKWFFINKNGDYDEKVRGPFDQAWEGIYSVKTAIDTKVDEHHKHLKNMIFGIGVMFPDIEYSSVGIEEEQWQVFDINDGKSVGKFIERLAKGAVVTRKRLGYQNSDYVKPSTEDVRYLVEILRGDFDRDVPLKIKEKYAEESFISLTKEQSLCIEQLSDNPRSLIRGSAGTGKTLLAIEAAKKYSACGEKVALFCYNKLLGKWLTSLFQEMPKDLQPAYVGTFHSYMLRSILPEDTDAQNTQDPAQEPDFFTKTLPDLILNKGGTNTAQFDRLIIDEAQDLITNKYLDVMELILKNGLSRGKWILFGDFSMQAIYSNTVSEAQYLDEIQSRSFFSLFKLTKNCRNTKKICIDIENIIGIPENAAFDDYINTPAVDHIIYADYGEQKIRLINLITELKEQNIDSGDIVILSPRKLKDSVVSELKGIKIVPYSVKAADQIRFSTIHAFKGLESSTVILTDIESYSDEKIIYVGLSRARFGLHVLESQQAYKERVALFVKRRLKNG